MPTAVASRRTLAALVATFALLCAAAPQAFAGVSLGSGNLAEQAESESSSSSPSSTSTTGTKESKEAETTNSNHTLFIGIAVAVVLLGGIGFVIVRDARRRAPVSDAATDAAVERSHLDHQSQLRRKRARAKAARQQRKRNR